MWPLFCRRREKREAERKQQLLEEHQKEITALKDEAYDRLGAIDTLCNRLNNGLHILKMCPKDAKYAKKQDLAIQVRAYAAKPGGSPSSLDALADTQAAALS